MIEGGYIIRPRKVYTSWLMDKPPLWWKLWDWMVAEANFKDNCTLRRGQLFTTIKDMQDAMSWKVGYRKHSPTRDEIRSAYEAFTKTLMITTAKTTRGLIITICNYGLYQDIKNYEAHTEAHTENTTKPQATPHYKGKKEKEHKEENKKHSEFVLPEWVPVTEWNDYSDMRTSKDKKSWTAAAKKLNLKSLEKLVADGESPEAVLNQSTAKGWKGLFPAREPIKTSLEEDRIKRPWMHGG